MSIIRGIKLVTLSCTLQGPLAGQTLIFDVELLEVK